MPTPIRPERGRIIWAEFLDPQRRNKSPHPAVILTSREEIENGDSIVVAVVSTQYDLSEPKERVDLPWDPRPGGHAVTKLNKRCAAICYWTEKIERSDILRYAGVVPAAQLGAILTLVRELADDDSDAE